MPPVLSPHFSGRAGLAPYLLIIHSTRSGQARFTDAEERQATLTWFQSNPLEVSAHYVVDGIGQVTQCVDMEHAAHHAGGHNSYSFGVELTQPTPDRPYSEGHYAGAALCYELSNAWLRAQGWPEIPPQRVMTAFGPAGLLAHQDSEQGRSIGKSDPGSQWDWDRFLRMLA